MVLGASSFLDASRARGGSVSPLAWLSASGERNILSRAGDGNGEEGGGGSPGRFFSAGNYELEVSVRDRLGGDNYDVCCAEHKDDERNDICRSGEVPPPLLRSNTVVELRPTPTPSAAKTVYLIRHAESDENRRQQSFRRSLRTLTRGALPSKEDVAASVELLDVPGQLDSGVSPTGRRQIEQLGLRLRADEFLKEHGVTLVAHSPLKRARQTCKGMLGCVAPKGDRTDSTGRSKLPGLSKMASMDEADDSGSTPDSPEGVRVVELPSLVERTPLEWLPGPANHDAFTSRIATFERWLSQQKEATIAVVGHSHFFKSMLGLDSKFGNCDVWRVDFDASIVVNDKDVKKDVIRSDRRQRAAAIRRKAQKIQREIDQHKERIHKEIDHQREKLDRELKENGRRLKRLLSKPEGMDTDDGDEGDLEVRQMAEESSDEELMDTDADACDDRFPDELPRGWSSLVNLYRYEPEEEEEEEEEDRDDRAVSDEITGEDADAKELLRWRSLCLK